ncbi:MAG: hypothetical protein ACF8LK_01240 [Phycisphaerales bacterium JB041]
MPPSHAGLEQGIARPSTPSADLNPDATINTQDILGFLNARTTGG